jgi:hypothetical protein
MKYSIKSKIIPGLFLIASIFSACTKDFEKMNQNPNNPVNVPAINILTNAEQSGIARQMGGWIQHTYLGVWCQQWCKIQYIDEDRYMPRDMSGEFQASFINELKNLTIVIDQATNKENNPSLAAAGKIMRAWSFMYITDVWGDIPYSEALQGFSADGTLTPKYDTQESIYADLSAQLEEANQTLAATTVNFGSGDIIYGGDPVLWRKFANSLRLRLLNRAAGTPWTFTYNMIGGTQVTTNPGPAAMASADATIAAMLADPDTYPVFESNDDNALLTYPGTPYRNPIFNTLYTRSDQAISETMVNWLKARNDPRLYVYAQPISSTVDSLEKYGTYTLEYAGFQNGRESTTAPFPMISFLGTKIAYDENAPLYVLTLDEVDFIKAEHYLRAANEAAAQAAYEAGVAASMERWGLADGGTVKQSWGDGKVGITVGGDVFNVSYSDYLANPNVAWSGTAAEKFQKICEQRWAAIFGEGVQAYSEIRRTGFPARIFEYELAGAYYPNLGLPIRLQYALSEETYNTDNLAAAKLSQHIESINEGMFSTDGTTSQVWWNTRKNPIPTETDVPAK